MIHMRTDEYGRLVYWRHAYFISLRHRYEWRYGKWLLSVDYGSKEDI